MCVTVACERTPSAPAELGALSEFALRDQSGTEITRAALSGRPTVLNFIYTRCPDRCPIFTARFSNLQRKLGPNRDVQYASISVDPEFDTPEVLAEYAARYDAKAPAWRFLTGSLDTLQPAVIAAFRQHLEGREIQGELNLMEIVHGELFLLVDAQGQIRGFFGSDDRSFERLQRSLEALSHG